MPTLALRVGHAALGLASIAVLACGDKPELAVGPQGAGGSSSSISDGSTVSEMGNLFNFDAGSALDGGGVAESGFAVCGDAGCAKGLACKHGLCLPDLGTCAKNDDCPGDSYCDADMTCVPYGVPADKTNDPTCQRQQAAPGVTPVAQCEWPPVGGAAAEGGADPAAGYVNIYSTPVVADLNIDLDPDKLRPSVVAITWSDIQGRTGMLRVFDGRTCAEQMRIGGPDDPDAANNRPAYGTQVAIGDLDNDVGMPHGHPEIVTLHRVGFNDANDPLSVIAYGIDSSVSPPKLVRRWLGRICGGGEGGADMPVQFSTNAANFGPGIWDVDDDGIPEVIVDTMVFSNQGCLLNPPASFTPYIDHGVISTIADVDLDGAPDLVRYDGIYGWNKTTNQWELKPYFVRDTNKHKAGHVAVADIGAFSAIPGHPKTDKLPEIIVVSAATTTRNPDSTGTIRVQTITGDIVFGPIPLYAEGTTNPGGHGGPPTASDFDGDGQVEFAAAANYDYVVYDPDCVASPDATARPGGKCTRTNNALPPGILWAQPSSDYSSSETGSSIFDFDGDGVSEAVYRDECYLRVYKGNTGEVIYSAPASSGTGQELPVVADVNGNFATQIVVARALNGPNQGTGLHDCKSPDTLFPTSGAFQKAGGFVILRDPQDRWVSSRPIWNQHAYSITNVTDDARIPKSSDVKQNWEQTGLNNFRQNTQGELGKTELADLTVQLADLADVCAGQGGKLDFSARVCNRGTNPVQDGAVVSFYSRPRSASAPEAGDGGAPGTLLCSAPTATLLKVGSCTAVQCSATLAANADVVVVVDPDGNIPDCHPGNNEGASAVQLCPSVN